MKTYMAWAKYSTNTFNFKADTDQDAVDIMYRQVGSGWRDLYDCYEIRQVS